MVGDAWCVEARLLLTDVLVVVHFVVVDHIKGVLLQLGAFDGAGVLPIDFFTGAKVSQKVVHALAVHFEQLLVFLPHVCFFRVSFIY